MREMKVEREPTTPAPIPAIFPRDNKGAAPFRYMNWSGYQLNLTHFLSADWGPFQSGECFFAHIRQFSSYIFM